MMPGLISGSERFAIAGTVTCFREKTFVGNAFSKESTTGNSLAATGDEDARQEQVTSASAGTACPNKFV